MEKVRRVAGIVVILALLCGGGLRFFVSDNSASAETENPYLVETFVDEEGKQIDVIIVPGRPPEIKADVAAVPETDVRAEGSTLGEVPAFDWSYGCSATSAAMLFGYYDRTGYSNMYTGTTNGGVCPLDNSVWGPGIGGSDGECPLSATHEGIDGRATRGHVDDYWIAYGSTEQDPWITNGWVEHIHEECTGDFMGTNQSSFGNSDGSTTFGYYTDGSPWVNPDLSSIGRRDGCQGMKLFAESRGYSVVTNFNQLIQGRGTNPNLGFTFDDYMAEIDAGRPVLIHIEGHTMLGFGYDSADDTVYLHDTWDYSTHTMTWGGSYAGHQHYMVSAIQLADAPPSVTTGDATDITDNSATLNGNLGDLGTALSVDVSFEWGETTAYGSETTPESMVTTGSFSSSLPDLSPDTTYHFRAKAVGDGTNYGDDMNFTTEPPGLLRVETSPAVATTISVGGIPRNDWGLDWVKMPPGEYTLSFGDVPGYLTPVEVEVTFYPPEGDPVTQTQPLSQTIAVDSGVTSRVVASFIPLGNLRVETSPVLPVANTIFVDGNPMNDWGLWVNLEAGEYTVSFEEMDGYQTPPPAVVSVTSGVTTHVTGDYLNGETMVSP
jgi:hypothetical protein